MMTVPIIHMEGETLASAFGPGLLPLRPGSESPEWARDARARGRQFPGRGEAGTYRHESERGVGGASSSASASDAGAAASADSAP